tara:strand:+ start:551 stop:727 length:177 start_codon:yes stop_codon:yes gene_type:complete
MQAFTPWERKFPDVEFRDKVVVVYKDGSLENLKHLYLPQSQTILKEIDWDQVDACHEV